MSRSAWCRALAGRAAFVLPLAVALVACTRTGTTTPDPAWAVEYAGCAGARRGPVCVRTATSLSLWLPAGSDGVTIAVDGTPVPMPVGTEVQGGRRIELEVAAKAEQLSVVRGRDGARWTLKLETRSKPAWRVAADGSIAERAFDEAIDGLHDALETLTQDGERGPALALLGQLTLMRGETAVGRDLLRQSLPILHRAGDLQVTFDQTTALVFTLITRDHDFSEARERLDALPQDWQAPGEVRYFDAYYRGLLAMETGDARAALGHYESAAAVARRTGAPRLRRLADEARAIQLRRLGRHEEASAAFAALFDEATAQDDPCRPVAVLSNQALAVLQGSPRQAAAQQARGLLHRALALLDSERPCADQRLQRQGLHLNMALAALQADDPAAARRALDEAAAVDAERGLGLLLWWRDIEGRLALAEGDPQDALRRYQALEILAADALVPEASWRAQVGVARAFEALGEVDSALDAFARAEHQLDNELLLVPQHEGRESFLAQRERATAQYLALLLARDDHAAALALARRSRIRLLHQLNLATRLRGVDVDKRRRWEHLLAAYRDERAMIEDAVGDDWALAGTNLERLRAERAQERQRLARTLDATLAELAPQLAARPRPLQLGEATVALVVHPLPAGWVVLAQRGERLDVFTPACGTEDPTAIAACLVRAAAAMVDGASEIRILATGALAEVDFHALPYGDDALLATAPVIYDFDLGTALDRGRGTFSPEAEAVWPAETLIVADPSGDLPQARQEAETIERQLRPTDRIARLAGQSATVAAVLDALPKAALFHYAGHATFAGDGGWQTYLPLAEGGRLTLEDVLLLQRAPRWVVLSGCDTARTASGPSTAHTVGLAHAFLAAGTVTAIAATRPVDDRLAAELMRDLYRRWRAGAPPPSALQQAQLTLRRSRPDADWSSFRIVSR